MKLDPQYYKPPTSIFDKLKTNNVVNVTNIQNYLPIYNLLFKINDTNYNSINLKDDVYIGEFNKKHTDNTYTVTLSNNETKDIFIKYSPLLDPSKYLIGKYDTLDTVSLPKFNQSPHTNKDVDHKLNNPYNSSYVDGFFSYLSSHLARHHNFNNGILFYGNYLGNKSDFRYNLDEDIMYVHNSEFFNKHLNKLFTLDEEYKDLFSHFSKSNHDRLEISEESIALNDVESVQSVDTESPTLCLENLKKLETEESTFSKLKLLEELPIQKKNKTNSFNCSNCSSNVSNTTSEDMASESGESLDITSDNSAIDLHTIPISCISKPTSSTSLSPTANSLKSDRSSGGSSSHSGGSSSHSSGSSSLSGSSSASSDIDVFINIPNFPSNLICLEKCENTLDDYILTKKINEKEWYSILSQVVFTLLTYQKLFQFTHNDLHTNNIMYITTEKQYLYYHYNNTYYKIPTFGKIWKIIDFGRAIYTINNNVIYSDSFENGEDAYSQYNFDKFKNKNKKEILPNYSFDLCRLGCSLYEYFFYEDNQVVDLEKKNTLEKLVYEWCCDDMGKNILFKRNGEERYPNFKLYKMIARTVTKHTPENMLKKDIFKQFIITKNKINKKKNIFSITNILNQEDK